MLINVVRIRDVKLSDAGDYICVTRGGQNQTKTVHVVESRKYSVQ